ncbi:MAG: hypothetical protein BWY78_00286 [Alphaproteobacteria bacterium ADurb.Bin438]|nr:MAG: hypothetical protein BWY78_00286 [Alphaproteobacteria bacterium ADurb.Bin438]
MQKIYKEYGLDFDNNRYGFGKSTEIENEDGSEYRTKDDIEIRGKKRYYLRIWILKYVFAISFNDNKMFEFKEKNRNNFKIVFGIAGEI